MKVEKVSEHGDICGGCIYFYKVTFDTPDPTLGEALKEIKGWRDAHKDEGAHSTCVDKQIIESTWVGQKGSPYVGDTSKKIKRVVAHGGWCCGIDIELYTEV